VFKLVGACYHGINALTWKRKVRNRRCAMLTDDVKTHCSEQLVGCRILSDTVMPQNEGLRRKWLAQYLKVEVSRLIRSQTNRLSWHSNRWVCAVAQGGHKQLWERARVSYSDDHLGGATDFCLRVAHCSCVIANLRCCDLNDIEPVRNYQNPWHKRNNIERLRNRGMEASLDKENSPDRSWHAIVNVWY
jgi:hypothetical protein